jgi:hypothetical protein
MIFYCKIKKLFRVLGAELLLEVIYIYQVGSLITIVGYLAQHCTVKSFHDHVNIDLSQLHFVVGKVQCHSGN